MSMSDEQWAFLLDLATLIAWAEYKGYKLTGGDLYRDPRVHGAYGTKASYSSAKSNHKRRLAIDLNLFVWVDPPGRWQYVSSTEQHHPLGEYWESLSPENRWGGPFRDGNHYERVPGGWRSEGGLTA